MLRSPPLSTIIAGQGLPKIDRGQGVYVWDASGKQYIDGSGGPAVYSLGHGSPEVNAAIADQLERVAHGYRYLFTSDPLEELTDLIRARCGPELSDMVFVSGGSEAVESGLKLALQYHSARGEPHRRRFISRARSWHGNTLGALSVSDFFERRAPFEGSLLDVSFVSAANDYRLPCEARKAAEFFAAELDGEIERRGASTIAAFIFEPVVGAAGGVVPAPPGYSRAVQEVCDRHGVLLIADEVMCGAGRCGTWRALEHDGVVPDIMTVAKGLAGGYVPLGAAIYHRRVAEAITRSYGGPMTGHTFTGHTAACAAGVAVQRIINRDRLIDRVAECGPQFLALLQGALRDVGAIGDIRGRGYFVGVEFVRDRKTKEPFEPREKLFLKVRTHALDLGLICYPNGGNVDGIRGDTVILAPPYICTHAHLEEITDKFAEAVRRALAEVA